MSRTRTQTMRVTVRHDPEWPDDGYEVVRIRGGARGDRKTKTLSDQQALREEFDMLGIEAALWGNGEPPSTAREFTLTGYLQWTRFPATLDCGEEWESEFVIEAVEDADRAAQGGSDRG